MKKKILDGFSKIKQKIDDLNNSDLKESKDKKVNSKIGTEYIINFLANKQNFYIDEAAINEYDYYYTPSINNDSPIILVAVVAFHHKKGSIIEFIHPSKEDILKVHSEYFNACLSYEKGNDSIGEKILEDILNQLTYFCLPDAVHTTNEDAQFFFIQNYKTLLYGISCYRQIKTQSQEVDEQNTRDCVQKAICIVSKMPLFCQFYSKLSSTILAFFNQNTLKDKGV
jgi:hypothetical protein